MSNIHDEGSAPVEKPGTFVVAGDPTWTDYRVTVQFQSDTGGAIGVMFRYTDDENYYRFSMDDQQGYRRLVRKVGGTFTVLWEDSMPYERGHEYVLMLDA